MSIIICFDKGEPLHCQYRGTADFLCIMLEHIPNCGTRLGEQTVWKVKIDVK
jgi:hypothetical protein